MLEVLKKLAIYVVVAFLVYAMFSELFEVDSVTKMNMTMGVIVLFIGMPLALAGAMANDSGTAGYFIKLLQVLLLTFPLVYLIGLVSSIAILYMDSFENQQELALWLASIAGIQLMIAVGVFALFFMFQDLTEAIKSKHSND
ncbi:MAG: hypothetical protein U9N57_06245 [Pseudomonadota bacterium]|nr:hypothetical protein [Pseudomonadota bacterium]